MNNNDHTYFMLPFIEDQFIDVNNLWRSSKELCNQIGELTIGKRVITFLKTASGKLSMLGEVKWLGRINNIDCVGIDLDEPYRFGNSGKLDHKYNFEARSKHGVFTPMTNVNIVSSFTESVIPSQLKTSINISIDSSVKVYRMKSNKQIEKLYGTVAWTGYTDNLKYLYGIKLNSPVNDGTDGTFSFQRLFSCKPNLGILVPVGMVKLHENKTNPDKRHDELLSDELESYQSIIKMLLANDGNVNQLNENNESIFDIAGKLRNENFIYLMLDHCNQKLKLSVTKSMESILSNLVESENWDLLFQVIDHAHVDETSNKYLLFLCISVLKKRNTMELFDEIISICLDKNAILQDGETFLTALLKSDINQTTIISILNRKLFDINKENLQKEVPLILACEYLLSDVVNVLIKFNCDLKSHKSHAIESVVLAKSKAKIQNDHIKAKKGSEIIELLSESVDFKELHLCQICMDRIKDTALNCGHTLCSICSEKLIQCPFCGLAIVNSLRIFL